jgi:hypothetical protein
MRCAALTTMTNGEPQLSSIFSHSARCVEDVTFGIRRRIVGIAGKRRRKDHSQILIGLLAPTAGNNVKGRAGYLQEMLAETRFAASVCCAYGLDHKQTIGNKHE